MTPQADDKQLAELSALADGTLAPERRAEVEARIAASPELKVLYERERSVVEHLHKAAETTRAPGALRARIEAERGLRRAPRGLGWPLRPAYAGASAAVLAVVALAVVLVSPAGTPSAPSVGQAASLALRGSSAAPPTPDRSDPAVKLGRNVEDVYFPNWTRFRWRAVGQRGDRLDGRSASTVYYEWMGKRIAYTIVSAPALSQPAASTTTLNGTELRTLRLDGRDVVTWRRAGHTCVLSGAGVNATVLEQLAAWKAPGLERG
jgi:anti-sigma factor RsiW